MRTNVVYDNILSNFDSDILYRPQNDVSVVKGDSLELLKKIPDHSIALILTDPPYHSTNKKNITGDTRFKKDEDFLNWMEQFSQEWKRVLKFNGSVYCFCSSQMEYQLISRFSKDFNILSTITWTKPNKPGHDGWRNKMKKESLRQWYPLSERIIFMAPKYGNNLFNSYFGAKLRSWRKTVKISGHDLTEIVGAYGKVNHGGAVSNWEAGRNIPSREQYGRIVDALRSKDINKLIKFPDYEDIIRPFNVDGSMQYTDVWTFENVRQYRGKHPAEKPIDLLENAIKASSYDNDIILDTFSGSGSTAEAAFKLNRKSISMEIEDKWVRSSVNRLKNINEQLNM